jgi:hypothetical protein
MLKKDFINLKIGFNPTNYVNLNDKRKTFYLIHTLVSI